MGGSGAQVEGMRSSIFENLFAMECFSGEQRALCLKAYNKHGHLCIIVWRLFRPKFRLHCFSPSVLRLRVRNPIIKTSKASFAQSYSLVGHLTQEIVCPYLFGQSVTG